MRYAETKCATGVGEKNAHHRSAQSPPRAPQCQCWMAEVGPDIGIGLRNKRPVLFSATRCFPTTLTGGIRRGRGHRFCCAPSGRFFSPTPVAHFVSTYLIPSLPPYLISSYLSLPYLISSHFISSHLSSPYLISSHLI